MANHSIHHSIRIDTDFTPITSGRLSSIGPIFWVRQPNGTPIPRIVCECSCGNVHVARYYEVANGKARSCGCLTREATAQRNRDNAKHGEATNNGTKEYRAWRRMIFSCYNENAKEYHNYGGRGIVVCSEWLDPQTGFTYFLSCVGRAPSARHSIDRKDVNGNYCPENCRWATPEEQGRNRRNNRLLTAFGETKPLVAFAEQFQVCPNAVAWRLGRGWSAEDALAKPMQKKTKFIAGLSKMAKEHGIDDGTVRNRISRGWDLETALKTPLKYTKKKT